MKTRSNMPIYVLEVSDIKALSNSQINQLRCGDYLVKKDATGQHAYKVTFKSTTGICLTYHDAYCVETQSYDLIDGVWTYNSEDKTIIAEPSMENIVDKDGHKRFIEGDGTPSSSIEGLTSVYCKWSLSGTHLMCVFAGSLDNGTILGNGNPLCTFTLPQWIRDKIYHVWSANRIALLSAQLIADDWSQQSLSFVVDKILTGIQFTKVNELILTADRHFRIQFDLLIDNE